MTRFFAVYLLLAGLFSSPASAQLSDIDLRSALVGSVVRIEVSGVISAGEKIGTVITNIGTGTIVSESGYVITAKHLLRDHDGNDFTGIPEIKVFLSSDKSKVSPLIAKSDGIRRDPFVDAVLLKVPEPDEAKFTPATVCNGHLKPATPIVAFGYPAGLSLAYRPGNIDSFDGPDNYWQASISTFYGMSGGPVVNKQAQVVGLVFGAQTASLSNGAGNNETDIYTLVVPASSIVALLGSAGVKIETCVERSVPEQSMSANRDAQIRELYAPLYSEIAVGEANFNVFRESFSAKFGRTSPVQYRLVTINGKEQRQSIPMSNEEWIFWMLWVDKTFIPENRKIGALIRTRSDLLVGGVLTPCMKSLLLHFSAFDNSYQRAKSSPNERVWQPDHGWPLCIGPEVEGTLARLTAARERGS